MNRPLFGRFLLYLGLFLIWVEALLVDASHGIFRSEAFAERITTSLGNPDVSRYLAEQITDAVIAERPNLVAVRPIIVSATGSLVQSEPFRAVARRAIETAHASAFSKGSEQVLLSLPDVGILLRNALGAASPQLAAKIPDQLGTAVARMEKSRAGAVLQRLHTLWSRIRWVTRVLLFVGPLVLIAGIVLLPDRRRGLVRAGIGLIVVGLLVGMLVPLGRVVTFWAIPKDPGARAALFGLWRAYFLGLFSWAATLAGTGVVLAAAGTSLYEDLDPFNRLKAILDRAVHPPASRGGRTLWALALSVVGTIVLIWPTSVLTATAVLIGLLLIYAALREVFRLALERMPQAAQAESAQGASYRLGFISILAGAIIGGILIWWRPTAAPMRSAITTCNGSSLLCDRRVNEVVFPGAHNAMSNAEAVGWMFPHHQKGIPAMLQDGVRALLIDIHYGIPTDQRVKTDLDAEQSSLEKIEGAVGPEGTAAAMRIRDRLVVGKGQEHGLFFCHGFCELGAYPVVPVLRDVRDFMVEHPDQVIIMVIEDYVTPEDLKKAFDESGLTELVDTLGVTPPWATLRQLIDANQRVIVFTESGRPGVAWLHPTLGTIQETPYTFHQPSDFSCRPNRGDTTGSLFQINHWIETTPAPKPSNAALVNAYDALLARARECQRARGHLPNVIAVDFYDIGDLFRVARTLNGLPDSLVATK
jgi:hypothetical protein